MRATGMPDWIVMMTASQAITLAAHGALVTYSRKVFIPLTRLCRDVCHYCTFATTPRLASHAYLSPAEVLVIAHARKAAGCREALFTLGDRPEDRYPAARDALAALGYGSTLDYLGAMAALVLAETGLLPHLNPGLMDDAGLPRPTATPAPTSTPCCAPGSTIGAVSRRLPPIM